MIKSILFNFIFYFSILFFGILFLPFLISRKLTRHAVKFWAFLVIFFLKKIIGVKVIFKNEYISDNKGYLIAANHQSVFDTIFFLKEFDKVIYVVKKELMFIPIYGWYALRLGNIFVNRKERIKSVKNISEKVYSSLNKNYKVIIFPEGTRQIENKIGEMKPGIYAIQKFCNCLVYPIYISSNQVWPKNTFIKKNKHIRVKTLAPIKFEEEKKEFLAKLKNNLEIEKNEYINKL
jgi:1-acyl-sn-glycerol-3-phosphate acyltransferase